MKALIVPGVGGSEKAHWQSWLQEQLHDATRVEQDHWNKPVLDVWVQRFTEVLLQQTAPVQVVAHSFGCLTSVAALTRYPALKQRIAGLLLVAPANPERFSISGLRQDGEASIAHLLQHTGLPVPTQLIASRNDPWLSFNTAQSWATLWAASLIDLGEAGHINVAAGYGAWPGIFQYLPASVHKKTACRQQLMASLPKLSLQHSAGNRSIV
jgi:predicted alpha/beta hydrolase family esterase